jgi:hypothetical protein
VLGQITATGSNAGTSNAAGSAGAAAAALAYSASMPPAYLPSADACHFQYSKVLPAASSSSSSNSNVWEYEPLADRISFFTIFDTARSFKMYDATSSSDKFFFKEFGAWESGSDLAACVAEGRGVPYRIVGKAEVGEQAAAVELQPQSSFHRLSLQPGRAGQHWRVDSVGPPVVAKLPLQLEGLDSSSRMEFVREQLAAAGLSDAAQLGHLGLRVRPGGPLLAVPCVLVPEQLSTRVQHDEVSWCCCWPKECICSV